MQKPGLLAKLCSKLCAMLAPGATASAAPRAYITDSSTNEVSVIDTASNTVIATVPVGDFPAGAAVSPDGAFVYVANVNGHTVSVIDAASLTVVATIQ